MIRIGNVQGNISHTVFAGNDVTIDTQTGNSLTCCDDCPCLKWYNERILKYECQSHGDYHVIHRADMRSGKKDIPIHWDVFSWDCKLKCIEYADRASFTPERMNNRKENP